MDTDLKEIMAGFAKHQGVKPAVINGEPMWVKGRGIKPKHEYLAAEVWDALAAEAKIVTS